MSSIVRQKVGNNIYLYESVSYRNEEGKPRNKRKPIGKIDPLTGEAIYKPEYLKRMGLETPLESGLQTTFSTQEIQQSSIRDFGAFYLFEQIAKRAGLIDVLKEALPSTWKKIFNLASYLLTTGDPFAYCEDWLSNTEAYDVGSMSSQRISELLNMITAEERDLFYQLWCQKRSEREYLALDITSTSSYSQLVDSVEWGYNRDGEKLPQINLCLLMGYESRFPIYQKVYNGSLGDVSTLKATLSNFHAIACEKPLITVMDKGFFSTQNINAMLSRKQHTDFIIAVPFTHKFARNLVISERKDIDTLENTLVCGKDTLRGVTKIRSWNSDHKVYAHVYYNAKKATSIRDDLYAEVATLHERASADPEKYVNHPAYKKYFIIRKSEKTASGYTVNVRQEKIDTHLETAGWLIIISNFIDNAKEAIKIYREKDVVEKGFMKLKNSLDLARIRVHSESSMENKVFVGFISLILLSGIHHVMMDKELYTSMSIRKLILTLSKLKVHFVSGVRILAPVTKKQKDIYKAFGFNDPL
jgi:transposase